MKSPSITAMFVLNVEGWPVSVIFASSGSFATLGAIRSTAATIIDQVSLIWLGF
jgi:hypothetical protein